VTFIIFRRHYGETWDSKNRYDPKCGCPLHVQFVWKNGDAVFEGKCERSRANAACAPTGWVEPRRRPLRPFLAANLWPRKQTIWERARLQIHLACERAYCTISTSTFRLSAGLLTPLKNAMRAPRIPSVVRNRT
jgi:hypothetical protein